MPYVHASQRWGTPARHSVPTPNWWDRVTAGEIARQRARQPGQTRQQARAALREGKRQVLVEFAESSIVGLRRSMSPQTKAALGQILLVGLRRRTDKETT